MNIKTKLLEEYVNFVDNTKKQNKYFRIFLFLMVLIMVLFLCYVFFIHCVILNESYSFFKRNKQKFYYGS